MNLKPLLMLALLASVGCSPGPTSSHGFRLPDGEVEVGRAVFAQLQCVACHSVEGADLAAPAEGAELDIRLGGKVLRVRSYGELVTAVINPSHDIAQAYQEQGASADSLSPMADHNATLTVQELIDLVAFLQSTYVEYLPDDYDPYFP